MTKWEFKYGYHKKYVAVAYRDWKVLRVVAGNVKWWLELRVKAWNWWYNR